MVKATADVIDALEEIDSLFDQGADSDTVGGCISRKLDAEKNPVLQAQLYLRMVRLSVRRGDFIGAEVNVRTAKRLLLEEGDPKEQDVRQSCLYLAEIFFEALCLEGAHYRFWFWVAKFFNRMGRFLEDFRDVRGAQKCYALSLSAIVLVNREIGDGVEEEIVLVHSLMQLSAVNSHKILPETMWQMALAGKEFAGI